MTGKEALGLMLIDYRIAAIRDRDSGRIVLSAEPLIMGINFTPEQLTSDKWELGRECFTCLGTGEVTVPCPRCAKSSLQSLRENPCCGGYSEVKCQHCEDGTVWSEEY